MVKALPKEPEQPSKIFAELQYFIVVELSLNGTPFEPKFYTTI